MVARTWWFASLAPTALLALVGCKSSRPEDLAFSKVESLPGFEIALPATKPLRTNVTPAAGEILIRKDGAVLAVSWQAGRMPKDDLPTYGRAAMGALGATIGAGDVEQQDVVLPAPNYGVQMLVPTDKRVILVMSLIQCAHSNVTITLATMASNDRAKATAFHQRLTAGLRCKEDGVALTTNVGLAAFDQGDSIGYLPGSDPPSYYSLGGERWHVTPGTTAQRNAFKQPDTLKQMFAGMGLEVVDQTRLPYTGAADWLQFGLTFVENGQRGQMLVGSLNCAAAVSYAVIYMNAAQLGERPDPTQLERVTCATVAIDPERLPTVAGVFGAACDRGEGEACAGFAGLIDEEPTLFTGHDPAKLRARACELGVTAACP